MRRRLCLWTLALILSCLLISVSGCDLTLGPKVKTVYAIVYPGRPLEILENVKVRGKVLDGTEDPVMQDVGGWIVMPKEHFDAMKRAIEKGK